MEKWNEFRRNKVRQDKEETAKSHETLTLIVLGWGRQFLQWLFKSQITQKSTNK